MPATKSCFMAICLAVLGLSLSVPPAHAADTVPTGSQTALQHMEQFHLRQAEEKISKAQLAHAWGDLAYLVAYTPNHHQALSYMVLIAPQINKNAELEQYFERALTKFPDDQDLRDLHAAFVKLQQTGS